MFRTGFGVNSQHIYFDLVSVRCDLQLLMVPPYIAGFWVCIYVYMGYENVFYTLYEKKSEEKLLFPKDSTQYIMQGGNI